MDMFDPAIIWFIIGVALLVLEMGAPGVVLGFFGLGALLASITTWMGLTQSLTSQSLVFAISSVVLLAGLRRYAKKWFTGRTGDTDGNSIEDEFTGKEALALTDFIDGKGLVEIKGARWNARTESSIHTGQTVIIVRRENLTLHVRSAS